jgi:putative ABC transport system permease protein
MAMVLKVAWRHALRDRRRSLGVVVAMALSIAALTAALALLIGMRRMFMELAFDTVGHVTVEREGYRERAAMLPVDLAIDDPAPLLDALRRRPDVAGATVELVCGARLLNGERSAEAMVRGIDLGDEGWNRRYRQAIVEGAFPTGDGSVILGRGLARYLALSVGDRLTLLAYNPNGGLNAVSVILAGVFATDRTEENEDLSLASLDTVRRLLQVQSSATAVLVRLRDADDTARVVAELGGPLATRHLAAHAWRDVYAEIAAGLVWVNIVIVVLFSIIVGVVVSGIANTHLIAVFERVRTLGTMRAIGMSRWGIAGVVVAETGLTGLLGSIVGVALGALVVALAGRRGIDMGPQLDGIARVIRPAFTAEIGLFCLVIGVCVSALAAVYPAWLAGKMKPIEALSFR